MATRFYVTSSSSKAGLPAGTPAVDAAWQESGALVRRRALTYRDLSAATSITATSTATNPELHVHVQAISDPVSAQTISGTLTCQFRCAESAVAGNGTLQIGARVIADDGTVRGTLLAVTGSTTTTSTPPEFATSLTNRQITGASSSNPLGLTNVTAVAGDRIVFEIGSRDASGGSQTFDINIGAPSSATDLAADNTTTTANNPWVEVSGAITFLQQSAWAPEYSRGLEQVDAGDIVASGMLPRKGWAER